MKYIAFITLLVVLMPILVLSASTWARTRSWLLTALIVSTAIGDMANIQFWSWETYRGPDRGFEVNLTDLIAWSLVVSMLLRHPQRLRAKLFNARWMGLFFVLAVAGSLRAQEPLLAAFTLFKLLKIYVLYWCVVNCLRYDVPFEAVWRALIAIGLLFLVLAIKQKYMDGIFRIPGPFDHSNSIPPFLHPLMTVLLLWGMSERDPLSGRALVSTVVALSMTLVVVSTQSRAGLLLMAGNLVLGLLLASWRARSGRVGILTAVIVLLMGAGGLKATDSIVERFRSAPDSSHLARVELNHAAWLMLDDHPLLGIGINQYSHVLTNTPSYRNHMVVLVYEKMQGVCHHIYLLTAAEMGYPGMVVFLIIIGRFLLLLWRQARLPGSQVPLLATGLLLGFVAVHLQGFLEWGFRITPVLYIFIIMSGVGVALEQRVQARAAHSRARPLVPCQTPAKHLPDRAYA